MLTSPSSRFWEAPGARKWFGSCVVQLAALEEIEKLVKPCQNIAGRLKMASYQQLGYNVFDLSFNVGTFYFNYIF